MAAQLGDDARRLLDGANFGHLSTLLADGAPKVDPVWVMREGDRILVTTDARSIKAMNVARDERVALSVIAFEDPYEQLLVRGRIVDGDPTRIWPCWTRSPRSTSARPFRAALVEARRPRHRAPPRPSLPVEARGPGPRREGGIAMTITRTVDDDGIAVVTMNNPPVNAITVGDTWAICDVFDELSRRRRRTRRDPHGRGQGLQRRDRHQGDAVGRRVRPICSARAPPATRRSSRSTRRRCR